MGNMGTEPIIIRHPQGYIYTITYDNNTGNKVSGMWASSAGGPEISGASYGYDEIDRLTSITESLSTGSTSCLTR